MHIHILGICGTFMAGIAALAREAGHKVTGSDANAWPPMSTQLEALGIQLQSGYAPEHLQPAPDRVVVGNVVTRGNPAMEFVLNEGLPYTSGPQWLAEHILRDKHVLAVAGTHGKTTTASLLAWLLESAGLEPGFLIGGVPLNFGVSARMGGGQYFVVEADEYDTAFFDKRSKFVHYRPRTLVLNNLEFDHADIFDDLAAIERQFHHLVRTVPGAGTIVNNGADANLARVLEMGCWTPVRHFNSADGWHIAGVNDARELHSPNGQWSFQSPLAGDHNRANAAAAIAAANAVGVGEGASIRSLAQFQCVRRRLELRGSPGGISVYDDFAHHPTAIAETIKAARELGPGRLIAVLEPRSNTMRRGSHAAELAPALAGADAVFVLNREDLGWDAASLLAPLADKLQLAMSVDELQAQLVSVARPGDRMVLMSNGDFGGLHQRLLDALGAARSN